MRQVLILAAASILAAGSAEAQPGRAMSPATQARAAGGATRPVLFRHANVDLAWQTAQQSGRPVMVFVTSGNCFYCKKMLAETLSHPQIATATNHRYETAVLSNDRQPELVERLGVKAFPTTIVVGTDGSILASVRGFVEPAKFAAQLLPPQGLKQAAARPAPQAGGGVSQR
ncbi:MAG: thioredoxin family protein [Planctomycetota bacterium]